MRKALSKLLLVIALTTPALIVSAAPAQAHWDHWHTTTCQTSPGETSWYYINSVYGGNRITYWRPSTGYLDVLWPMVSTYQWWGWECGPPGLPITNYWQQTVCELGYCGPGAIQAFQNGQFAWHYGGPNANQPQYHPW